MSERWHWHDAESAVAWLQARPGDRRTLLLLASLPLVNASVLTQLIGLNGGASVYRSLERLLRASLIAALKPPVYADPPSRLYSLTDLGLATIALDQGIELAVLARHCHLEGRDLLALAPRLPELLAGYELLGALASAGPGWPCLVHWERPWRRRYWSPTAKTPVSVTLPASAVLSWGDWIGTFLLLPDLGGFPLRLYRPTLHRLLGLRHQQGDGFPVLVVATPSTDRAEAWETLLEEVRRARWEAGWAAVVVTWERLPTDLERLEELGAYDHPSPTYTAQRQAFQPLRPRRSSSPIPRLVGNVVAAPRPMTPADGLGRVALTVTPREHQLLDLVAQHPFLTPARLAAVLGWRVSSVRRRLRRLMALGLMRLVGEEEIGKQAAWELVELTARGLELVAAQRALTLPVAIRELGMSGGGPEEPLGSRARLLRELAHTMGVHGLVVGLYTTARRLADAGSDDAVLAWQNATTCSRRHLRPDGYGMVHRDGAVYGFFLEFDRSTMRRHGYVDKLEAYYDYGISHRYEREYSGYPTILLVTTSNTAEETIAQVARESAEHHGFPLPLLLSSTWRVEDPRNPEGLLGPIWREPGARFEERRLWLPQRHQRKLETEESMPEIEPAHSAMSTPVTKEPR